MCKSFTADWRQAKAALREVFDRFDASGGGTLSRAEYDMLLMCTDGESSDDDAWQYMLGALHMGGMVAHRRRQHGQHQRRSDVQGLH